MSKQVCLFNVIKISSLVISFQHWNQDQDIFVSHAPFLRHKVYSPHNWKAILLMMYCSFLEYLGETSWKGVLKNQIELFLYHIKPGKMWKTYYFSVQLSKICVIQQITWTHLCAIAYVTEANLIFKCLDG